MLPCDDKVKKLASGELEISLRQRESVWFSKNIIQFELSEFPQNLVYERDIFTKYLPANISLAAR